jgi:hypothetical protein
MSAINKLLLRRREAADVLGFSQAQILKFERQGLLTPIAVEGLRSVRYSREQVESLAQKWINAGRPEQAIAV